MAIGDDFSFDYLNKVVTHDSGSTVYTANAVYSWAMDTFDELAQMDDDVPMSAQTPQAYRAINGWFFHPLCFEYIDGGTIETVGYNDEIHKLTIQSSGYTNAVAGDIGKTVKDDGVDFGTLLGYNNDKRIWWVRTGSATVMAASSVIAITGGTGAGTLSASQASETGECQYSNVYTLGTIHGTPQMYIDQNGAKITDFTDTNPYWWSTGHIDVLVKTTDFGTEIDSGLITIFCRNYPTAGGVGNISTYDHFQTDLSSGGRTPVPIATEEDKNNTMSRAAAKALADTNIGGDLATGIGITFGSISRDLGNGDGFNTYHVDIDCNSQSIQDVFEVMKWATNEESPSTLTNESGSIAGYLYTTYGDVSGWAEVKKSPFGTFAGGKFFGARGVWLSNVKSGDEQAFELIDSSGDTQVPPNVVSCAITSVVSGDACFMAELDGVGGSLYTDKYTGAASGNDSGDPDFVLTASIASDEPSSGWFRIAQTDGTFDRYKYSSYSGSTLTLDATEHPGGLSKNYNASEDVMITIIDDNTSGTEISNTLTYGADTPVIVRVRKYGIVPFEIEGLITSSGLTQAAIRTTDTIVS